MIIVKNCKAKLDDDYIAMVEIFNSPSEGSIMKQENANRTGNIVWIKQSLADRIFAFDIITTPMVFVEPEVVEYLTNLQIQEV